MSKRRKEPLGPFAGVDRLPVEGLPSDVLGVLGTKVTLHEDASGSISSAVERALLVLGSDKDNIVDRFDVRLLLDDLSGVTSIRPTSASALPDQEHEEELDEERYADLVHPHQVDTTANDTASADIAMEHNGSYQAVGLSYGNDSVAVQDSEAADLFDPGFDVPAEHQHAMRGMTEQQHKVMVQTANFVRQEGGQLELVLRVRQGHNASFSFLKPDSPLYDYYRWLVHAQPLAREVGQPGDTEAVTAAPADVKEQHEEPGGALSHLISMYGASQEVSHDDAGTSPEGKTRKALAPETGHDQVLAPPDDQAAEGHSVPGGPLQPEQAPFTMGSSDQQHGRRVAADTGGSEVAEQPSQQEQRAEQPPAEVQGIVAKLLAFVKKSGLKFEASIRKRERGNSRFGFLLPGHPFHGYYREQIMSVLGKEKAAELLATLPADTAAAAPEQNMSAPSAAQAAQAPRPQASGEAVQVTIRSNPTLARIAFARRQTPLAKAAPMNDAGAGAAQELDQACVPMPCESGAADPEGTQTDTGNAQDNGDRSIDSRSSDGHDSAGVTGDRDEGPRLSDVLMEGDAEQHAQRATAALAKAFDKGQGLDAALQAAAEADARKADEVLKAERRRLAMQLLAARRSEAEKARKEERNAPTAQAIARHRLALLAEESESQDMEPEHEAEAGEITVAKADRILPGAQVRVASLPRLEEVIRPPPPTQEASSESSSSSSNANDVSQNNLNGMRSRGMRSSPNSEHRPGSPRRHRSQRKRKHSAGRSSERSSKQRSRRSAAYSAEEDSSGSDSRHRRKPSPHTERRWAKRSQGDADGHGRHKRKRSKKEAGREEEHRRSQSRKALDELKSSKSVNKQKRRSLKRHDWGNTQPEAKQIVAIPSAGKHNHTVSVSEVPDALRARIKAMLAQS